jgi:hypothetical protein
MKFEKIDLPWDINECLNAYEHCKKLLPKNTLEQLHKDMSTTTPEMVISWYKPVFQSLKISEQGLIKAVQYIDYCIDNLIAYGEKLN